MCLSFAIFVLGTPRYARKPPGGNSLMGLCHCLFQAAKASRKGLIGFTGWIVLLCFLILSVIQVCNYTFAGSTTREVLLAHCLQWTH